MIVLSMHSETVYVREALRSGVNGYVLKRNAVSELDVAIEEVMAGRHFISPAITRESPDELLSSTGAFFLVMISRGANAKCCSWWRKERLPRKSGIF